MPSEEKVKSKMVVSVLMPAEDVRRLAALAAQDERTVSHMIRKATAEYLGKQEPRRA